MARQEWCNGSVGVVGQVLRRLLVHPARRPPAAGAAARSRRCTRPTTATPTTCTTTAARCAAFELSNYPIRMIGMNALPPGDGEGPEFDAAGGSGSTRRRRGCVRWLTEQHDGPYWRNGSLRPDYERIECPVVHRLGLARRLPHGRPAHGRAPGRSVAAAGRPVDARRPRPRRARAALPVHGRADRVLSRPPRPGAGPPGERRPRSVVFIEEHDSPAAPREQGLGRVDLRARRGRTRARETVLTLGDAADRAGDAPPSASPPATGARPRPDSGLFGDQRSRRGPQRVLRERAADASRSRCSARRACAFGSRHPGPRAIVSVKLNDVSPGGRVAAGHARGGQPRLRRRARRSSST